VARGVYRGNGNRWVEIRTRLTLLSEEGPEVTIDAGSRSAEEAGMSRLSTRTSLEPDADVVDIGYHYNPDDFSFNNIIFGYVTDFATDEPLEGAVVRIDNGRQTTSDAEGYYQFIRPLIGDFVISASAPGYNEEVFGGQRIGETDSLQIDFALLHPEFALAPEEINIELIQGSRVEESLTLVNAGNGPLEWTVRKHLPEDQKLASLTQEGSLPAAQGAGADQLTALTFAAGSFYVAGSSEGARWIYALDPGGERFAQFRQLGCSRDGMSGLTWDGNWLWGVDDDTVYAFDRAGNLQRRFPSPLAGSRYVAVVRSGAVQILLLAGIETDVVGCDVIGNSLGPLIDRQGLSIGGMALLPEDKGDDTLLVLHQPPGGSSVS